MISLDSMMSGGEVQIGDLGDLLALNDILRKSATAGYQTASSGGGTLGPLMPQSIQPTLDSATNTQRHLKLWPMLTKESIAQTLHEFTRIDEHGLNFDPFMAEGGGGTANTSQYTKSTVRVRYLSDRRQVSDVASMVGILGPNPNAVAEETDRGTNQLLRMLEYHLIYGDSDANSLAFDGLQKLITDNAPANVEDARGQVLTPKNLSRFLAALENDHFAETDLILMPGRQYQTMVEYAMQFGRHDQMTTSARKAMGAERLIYGPQGELQVIGSMGPVDIMLAPLTRRDIIARNTAAAGNNPSVPGVAAAPGAAPDAASKFVAADAGDYIYSFVGVNTSTDGGYSAPVNFATVTVAAGDAVTLDIGNGTNVSYWRVFRSSKDGAATTGKLIATIAPNVGGGAGTTRFIDYNNIIPDAEPIFLLQRNTMSWVQLLDFLRRPLSDGGLTVKPFLLMLFGALKLKVPSKNGMILNVGYESIV